MKFSPERGGELRLRFIPQTRGLGAEDQDGFIDGGWAAILGDQGLGTAAYGFMPVL